MLGSDGHILTALESEPEFTDHTRGLRGLLLWGERGARSRLFLTPPHAHASAVRGWPPHGTHQNKTFSPDRADQCVAEYGIHTARKKSDQPSTHFNVRSLKKVCVLLTLFSLCDRGFTIFTKSAYCV